MPDITDKEIEELQNKHSKHLKLLELLKLLEEGIKIFRAEAKLSIFSGAEKDSLFKQISQVESFAKDNDLNLKEAGFDREDAMMDILGALAYYEKKRR